MQNQIRTRHFWKADRFRERLGWSVLVGLVLAIVLVTGFGFVASSILKDQWAGLDYNVQTAIRDLNSPFFNYLFSFFTFIGGGEGTSLLALPVLALLIWRKHYRLAVLLVLALAGGQLLNTIFKDFFHRIRPDLADPGTAAVVRPLSYSFPSDHATMSLCYFGMLAYLAFTFIRRMLWRGLLIGLMVLIILMVGLSRIYFGFHYPTDVLGGWLLGGFWLCSLLTGLHRPIQKDENVSVR